MAVFLAGCAQEVATPVAQPVAAEQQPICGDRDKLLAELARRYSEVPRNWGSTGRGHMFELLISESGSWTLLVSQPNGISCIVAAGDYWGEAMVPETKRTTL